VSLGRLAAVCAVAAIAVCGCGSTTEPQPLTSAPATTGPTAVSFPSSSAPIASTTALPRRAAPAVGRPGRMWSVVVTFYGAGDNDPPGSRDIAHPNALHSVAGGIGTYANPVSLASDRREIAVGTRVYYPALAMYFVMEDDCAGCIDDWSSDRTPHIDLWAGNHSGNDFLACENALTPSERVTVEVNPPSGRPVDTRPLYDGRDCRT
jgi:hypothetical protein